MAIIEYDWVDRDLKAESDYQAKLNDKLREDYFMKARKDESYKGTSCDFCGVSDMPTRFDPKGEKSQPIVSHNHGGKQINLCLSCLKSVNPEYKDNAEQK